MFVFITGASSGLGREFAIRYANLGATLGLVARRGERLVQLLAELPGKHHIYELDVRNREALHAAAHDFVALARRACSSIDVVIANAGVSAGTLTQESDDFDVFREIFEINVLAMVATFEPFIPAMLSAQKGTLVGIASVAGVRGLPGAGAYSASKSAVTTYCESLRLELKPAGVKVVTIAPGYVKSEMTASNPYRMPFLMQTDEFVRQAVNAINRGTSYQVIPWQMSWVARIMKLLPNWLFDRLAQDAPRKPRR